jgi:hypothetical protein
MLISTLDALFVPAKVIPVNQYVPITSWAALKSQHSSTLSSLGRVATSAMMNCLFILLYHFMLILMPAATANAMPSSMSPQHQGKEESYKDP